METYTLCTKERRITAGFSSQPCMFDGNISLSVGKSKFASPRILDLFTCEIYNKNFFRQRKPVGFYGHMNRMLQDMRSSSGRRKMTPDENMHLYKE